MMGSRALVLRPQKILSNSLDWQQFAAYLFNIDGTLLNSQDAVHYNAFCAALNRFFGVESRLDNIPVHGNTDIGILRAAVRLAGREPHFESALPRALDWIRAEVIRNKKDFRPQVCRGV